MIYYKNVIKYDHKNYNKTNVFIKTGFSKSHNTLYNLLILFF